MTANAQDGNRTQIMNDNITSIELKNTFGTCSGAPGQDGIQKDMIDKADKESMQECLHYIFKSAWRNGEFLDSWEFENRNVLPKPDKNDYHMANS